MSIRVALHHATRYTYDRPIGLGPQVIRLRPAPHCRTPILSYQLDVQPANHFLNWQQDPQANWLARVLVPEADRPLYRYSRSGRGSRGDQPVRFFSRSSGGAYPFAYDPQVALELAPYLACRNAGRSVRNLSGRQSTAARSPRRLHLRPQRRAPAPRSVTSSGWSRACKRRTRRCARVRGRVATRRGCWCNLLRRLGLAARFASGYLIQLKARRRIARRAVRCRCRISPICTRGAKSICPAPAGSGSIRRRVCLRARDTFRSRARRTPCRRRPSPAPSIRAR